jgi:hypothetical protein
MCFDSLNERIKRMKWFDISILKLSVAAFILMLAKLWSGILYMAWYWYLIIGLVTCFFLLYRMYR